MNLNIDWGGIVFALLLGYIDDVITPQAYHYQDTIVVVDKKYQCPKHCKVSHQHSVYYEGYGMIIDKNQLGKKVKKKKSRRKK